LVGNLEVKFPTIWIDEKQSREEAERRGRLEERRVEETGKKKEDADGRKDRKVAKHCIFPIIWVPGWSKSRHVKAAGAEPAGQMRDEKLHAVVNVQITPASDHFWKLRCRKALAVVARGTDFDVKMLKILGFGPLLEVAMSKKCTPLWREAHFEVKMHKTHHVRTSVRGSDVASRGRRKGLCTLSKEIYR
jgi:hypothetical protein